MNDSEQKFEALLKQRSLEPMDDTLTQRIIDAAAVKKPAEYSEPWWRRWLIPTPAYAAFASLVVVAAVMVFSLPEPVVEPPREFEISDAEMLEEVFYYPDEAFF